MIFFSFSLKERCDFERKREYEGKFVDGGGGGGGGVGGERVGA